MKERSAQIKEGTQTLTPTATCQWRPVKSHQKSLHTGIFIGMTIFENIDTIPQLGELHTDEETMVVISNVVYLLDFTQGYMINISPHNYSSTTTFYKSINFKKFMLSK